MVFINGKDGGAPALLHCCLAVAVLTLVGLCAGCGRPVASEDADIVAGTSLIADIVSDLTDQTVTPFTLLPSSSCPSQFDMRAGDIGRLQQARKVLVHPWQMDLGNIRRTLEAARLPDDRLLVVDVPGNWMLPDTQVQAVTALAGALSALFPEQSDAIATRAATRSARIRAVAEEARERLAAEAVASIVVLCNEMQAPFVHWVGFEVADTYARPEDWSVAETERLVRLGRERTVALVIDNLQSGGMRMSETVARDIGAINVVLSNFPNGFPDTPDWETTFLENINRLQQARVRLEPHEH